MKLNPKTKRREFLKGAAAVASTTLGIPYLVPGSALGNDDRVAPSERIVMASIGVGRKGGGE